MNFTQQAQNTRSFETPAERTTHPHIPVLSFYNQHENGIALGQVFTFVSTCSSVDADGGHVVNEQQILLSGILFFAGVC